LLTGLPIRLRTAPELLGHEFEVIEDGETFADNAKLKAVALCEATKIVALADDSGLEVDALDGQPGVYSARFAGPKAEDADNNRLLLERLRGVPAELRTARFRCVLALAEPSGRVRLTDGTCEGLIVEAPRGEHGFGYDPLFEPRMHPGRTMAEIGPEAKNQISHRAQAYVAIKPWLVELASLVSL
jgi:XTP/dITP diphosphohydrolase